MFGSAASMAGRVGVSGGPRSAASSRPRAVTAVPAAAARAIQDKQRQQQQALCQLLQTDRLCQRGLPVRSRVLHDPPPTGVDCSEPIRVVSFYLCRIVIIVLFLYEKSKNIIVSIAYRRRPATAGTISKDRKNRTGSVISVTQTLVSGTDSVRLTHDVCVLPRPSRILPNLTTLISLSCSTIFTTIVLILPP